MKNDILWTFEMLAPKIFEDRYNKKFVHMSADAFLAKETPIHISSFKETFGERENSIAEEEDTPEEDE